MILAQTTSEKNPNAAADLTQPPTAMQTSVRYYRIDRRDISFVRFILEAYEGIAVLTTIDPVEGAVKVTIAPGYEQMVVDLVDTMNTRQEIFMEPLPDRSAVSQGDE